MRAVVTEVKICAVPFTDPQANRPWDLLSGPDLCCEVYGPDGARLSRSGTTCDVRPPDLPVTLDGGFALAASGPHVLRVLDADLMGDEVMARIAFEPEQFGGPKSEPPGCVQFDDGDTIVQLQLSWEQSS